MIAAARPRWVICGQDPSEECISECEQASDFKPEFAELARAAYQHKGRRAGLRRRIEERFRAEITEETPSAPGEPA
jgi:hypothetical protein